MNDSFQYSNAKLLKKLQPVKAALQIGEACLVLPPSFHGDHEATEVPQITNSRRKGSTLPYLYSYLHLVYCAKEKFS